ncbi:hypothetical protein UFOVP116_276 [uncultured Caudovirales phage]|uniref:Uncharacterized protein n=1 Tax=uncultured Caudovirales phage TaxID=2100421 RepID=A0A6J5L9Z2_9CAUD|nr:hypothetical protein UFOVP116_276 [uncultured Caudovirales phage]
MRKDLNELYDVDMDVSNFPSPSWAGKLTKEKKHEFFRQVKESIPRLRSSFDVSRLEEAVAIYEKENGVI